MSYAKSSVPFLREHELCHELSELADINDSRLPGHPNQRLHDVHGLTQFIIGDLGTPELDAIASSLWIMTTYSSSNINPLHAQQIRGRTIVAAEYTRLHLTWKHSQIFIKPLPQYLLSYNFWQLYLSDTSTLLAPADRKAVTAAAQGLLRSYRYLIKHEVDFELAQKALLLPRNVTWYQYSEFMDQMHLLTDAEVTPRYHYGEIRLSRLNFYAPFLLRRSRYEWGRPQYSTYFNRFYGHILFCWAAVSLLLNALQTELAAEALVDDQWITMWYIARYVSITCFALLILTMIFGLITLVTMITREWIYAIRTLHSKRTASA